MYARLERKDYDCWGNEVVPPTKRSSDWLDELLGGE